MMIPMGELLAKAKKEGYGVAAPNVFNMNVLILQDIMKNSIQKYHLL